MNVQRFGQFAKKLLNRTDGATIVEYALMVGLIAVACLVGVKFLGISFAAIFSDLAKTVSSTN